MWLHMLQYVFKETVHEHNHTAGKAMAELNDKIETTDLTKITSVTGSGWHFKLIVKPFVASYPSCWQPGTPWTDH